MTDPRQLEHPAKGWVQPGEVVICDTCGRRVWYWEDGQEPEIPVGEVEWNQNQKGGPWPWRRRAERVPLGKSSSICRMKLAKSGSPVDVYWVGRSAPWWRPRWQYEVTPAPEWGEPWAGRAYTNVGAYWRGMRSFRRWARRRRRELSV